MAEEAQHRVEINWVQVAASTLAAVSSAVLLSTVGVAGTIIGAALGAMVASAASAIYSHYLEVTRARVAAAQAAARERLARARARASGAWADSRHAQAGRDRTEDQPQDQPEAQAIEELHEAEEELDEVETAAPKPSWREVLAGLRWKRIAAAAAVVFVVAMLVIVGFELLTGRAVSTYTGGTSGDVRTSIPGLGGKPSKGTPHQSPSPTATSTSTSTSTSTPTPTPTSTATPTATASEPTSTPSATSTASPSSTPTVAGTSTSTPKAPPASSTVPAPTRPPTGTPAG